MNNITRIIDIVGITVSILIIIIVSDSKPFCQLRESEDSDMDDSPNDQQVISDIRSGKLIPNPNNPRELIYVDRPRDGEVIWSSSYDNKQEVENSKESDESDDNEREEFTLDDFCNKWQSQPCTSMEICEYEDDERRVGLRSEPLNKQEPSFQSEDTDSKSSEDDNNDTYWRQFNLANKQFGEKQFDEYYYDWKWDDY